MELTLMKEKLESDMKRIGLPVDEVDIELAPNYSSSYYALYYPKDDSRKRSNKEPHIRIYPIRARGTSMTYPYCKVLQTGIHEMCHHLQFRDPNYTRIRGVVHDPEFWSLFNRYVDRAVNAGLIEEEDLDD